MAPSKKKPDVVTTFPNYRLHDAAAKGDVALINYALTHGQPVNAVLGGVLPLHAAASGGNENVVKLLIAAGADVNAPRLSSKTGPPLDVGGIGCIVGPGGVVSDGAGGSVSDKLRSGRSGSSHSIPSTSGGISIRRPGSNSASTSSHGLQSPPLPIGRRGSTPLHFAAAMGHAGVVNILLECGADPTLLDSDKASPENVARSSGHEKIAKLLAEWVVSQQAIPPPTAIRLPPPAAPKDAETTAPVAPSPNKSPSLTRYGGIGRRPSLPSIYESPPPTARRTGVKAFISSPKPLKRPRSAGTGMSSTEDVTSRDGHGTGHSRLNKILKKATNLRPGSASSASQPSTPGPGRIHHTQIDKSAISGLLSQDDNHTTQEHVSSTNATLNGAGPQPDPYSSHVMSPVELHYAAARGMFPSQLHQSPKNGLVPRHRAGLGPSADDSAIESYTRKRNDSRVTTGTSSSGIGEHDDIDPKYSTMPTPSRLQAGSPLSQRLRGNSVSSVDTSSTPNTVDSNDALQTPGSVIPSPAGEISRRINDRVGTPKGPRRQTSGSKLRATPSYTSLASTSPNSPISPSPDYGFMPGIDSRMISTRAQAKELAEAQRKAIQTAHEERQARRNASESAAPQITNEVNEESEEDSALSLRERLAMLGETVQIERRFARGEKQGATWNTKAHDSISSDVLESAEKAADLLRGEARGAESEPERSKRPVTPRRDVFGRPITPREKEGRPSTPKEVRPTTPKLPPTPRILDAPRENRVLPPAEKNQRQHTLPSLPTSSSLLNLSTQAMSRSELNLPLSAREGTTPQRDRAWSVTDTQPRLNIPSQSPANNSARHLDDGSAIDIIETMPTPSTGPPTPLKPIDESSRFSSAEQDTTLLGRRRRSKSPLRIDPKAAQDGASPSNARDGDKASLKSPTAMSDGSFQSGSEALLSSTSRDRKKIRLPVMRKVSASAIIRSAKGDTSTPPSSAPAPRPRRGSEATQASASEAERNYVPYIPGNSQGAHPYSTATGNTSSTWSGITAVRKPSLTIGRAAEKRLGLGAGSEIGSGFGFASVASLNEEKPDKAWRVLGHGVEGDGASEATKSTKSRKLNGLFSLLKR